MTCFSRATRNQLAALALVFATIHSLRKAHQDRPGQYPGNFLELVEALELAHNACHRRTTGGLLELDPRELRIFTGNVDALMSEVKSADGEWRGDAWLTAVLTQVEDVRGGMPPTPAERWSEWGTLTDRLVDLWQLYTPNPDVPAVGTGVRIAERMAQVVR